MATLLLDHVVRNWENIWSPPLVKHVGCIRSQPEVVRKCSGQFLDSNRQDIENIALSVLFRTTRPTLHCPIHGPSLPNFRWMGCRRYFAASRLEVLVDEDDFRSFLQALELGDVLLLSQLHVTVLVLWNQFRAPFLIHQHGSPSTCVIFFKMFRVSTRNALWILIHIRVSPSLLSLWLHHVSLD